MKTRKKRKPPVETRVSKSAGLGKQLELIKDDNAKRSVVDSFLSHGASKAAPKGKRGKPKPTAIEIAVSEAKRRSSDGDWTDAKGKVFVGLFALCHSIVYGEIPLELTEKQELTLGARMANKALHEYFADDPDALVEFVKWSWEAEKRKESWALRQGINRNRMRVRFQFSARLVQDYRVEKQRRRRRGR